MHKDCVMVASTLIPVTPKKHIKVAQRVSLIRLKRSDLTFCVHSVNLKPVR